MTFLAESLSSDITVAMNGSFTTVLTIPFTTSPSQSVHWHLVTSVQFRVQYGGSTFSTNIFLCGPNGNPVTSAGSIITPPQSVIIPYSYQSVLIDVSFTFAPSSVTTAANWTIKALPEVLIGGGNASGLTIVAQDSSGSPATAYMAYSF